MRKGGGRGAIQGKALIETFLVWERGRRGEEEGGEPGTVQIFAEFLPGKNAGNCHPPPPSPPWYPDPSGPYTVIG
jgi:hypothetical protein